MNSDHAPGSPLETRAARVDLATGRLSGAAVTTSTRTLGDLAGVFGDEAARAALDQSAPVYRVEMHAEVADGTAGGLFYGTSFVESGRVGDEYYMTKGHFHTFREAGEYYWCIAGEGALILMDEQRATWTEAMTPGSLHYIPGHTAHRLANTGDSLLVVGACWPANAGHDYDAIAREGFSARLMRVDGTRRLVAVSG